MNFCVQPKSQKLAITTILQLSTLLIYWQRCLNDFFSEEFKEWTTAMLLRVSEQSQNRGTPIICAKSIALIKILSKLLANQKWLLRNHMGQWKDNKHQSSLHVGKQIYWQILYRDLWFLQRRSKLHTKIAKSKAVVLKLCCTLELPGEPLKIPVPGNS